MPRAVVTGGAGFLGSHLCARLLDDGYDVVCLDNFLTGSPHNIEHLLERPGFRLVRADVSDYVHVTGPVDAVLHFASPASPIDYLKLPIHTLKVGSIGTLHTLGLAREKGARYLLASTSETYGDPQIHPQPETYWGHVNPVGPRGVYDEAKRFAEALTMAYRRTHGVDTAIVRIFNTFGERMRPDDGRAIPTFIRQALLGEQITVAGDGAQTRSISYVDDIVEGIVRATDRCESYHVWNLGGSNTITLAGLLAKIAGALGVEPRIRQLPDQPGDVQRTWADIDRAGRELDWAPQTGIDEGISLFIDWYQRHRGLLEERAGGVA